MYLVIKAGIYQVYHRRFSLASLPDLSLSHGTSLASLPDLSLSHGQVMTMPVTDAKEQGLLVIIEISDETLQALSGISHNSSWVLTKL